MVCSRHRIALLSYRCRIEVRGNSINFTQLLPGLQFAVVHFISYPLWKTATGYQAWFDLFPNDRIETVELQSGGSGAGAGEYPPQSTSPLQLTPSLDDVQIGKIRDTAAAIVKTLPPTAVESKTPTNKKKISKELEVCRVSWRVFASFNRST